MSKVVPKAPDDHNEVMCRYKENARASGTCAGHHVRLFIAA